MVNGLLQKTIFTNVPQLLGQSLQARAKDALGTTRYESLNRGLATSIATAFDGDADAIKRRLDAGDLSLGLFKSPKPATAPPPAGGPDAEMPRRNS